MLPKPESLTLRFFLDEGIPDEVGRFLQERGHHVTFGNKALPRSTADQIVAAAALNDESILVADDHDMKRIAKENGIGGGRFKALSLLKISCTKILAAKKIKMAISLIEHESLCHIAEKQRRIWIEIQPDVIRIRREFLKQ